MEIENPMISVCMITYNHESFINEAIKGVFNQQVDFDVEFVISNDCSTDDTHIIIEKLIASNTKKNIRVSYFNQESNLGVMPNFVFALQQCSGKYIAICEGDDYWTDPLKLQKQVDFLENNPEFVVTYHNAKVLQNDRISKTNLIPEGRCEDFSKDQIKKGVWMPTLTRCFKNTIHLPEEFIKVNYGDFFLNCIYAEYGKAKYLDFVGAVYRKHDGGVHSSITQIKNNLNLIHDFKIISRYYFNQNEKELSKYYKNRVKKERNSLLKTIIKTRDLKSLGKFFGSYV
ncbi:glycosyltransferase family 2 protein [Winogradskyella haliclonae]|uniref:Glycosyl transferase n=1 Tax=Winogradskyella haliclonae TaxID=2048558 RepID=A0ABQ2C117_9FLAO|nr:glycosyltransferase [Winogradskyella haliclonae]GGI58044.1 glycosyl transferase [Winogradskyella haliclonae]